MKTTAKWDREFTARFQKHFDELKQLYCETYNNDIGAFSYLCNSLYEYYEKRNPMLKKLDRVREKNPSGTARTTASSASGVSTRVRASMLTSISARSPRACISTPSSREKIS